MRKLIKLIQYFRSDYALLGTRIYGASRTLFTAGQVNFVAGGKQARLQALNLSPAPQTP